MITAEEARIQQEANVQKLSQGYESYLPEVEKVIREAIAKGESGVLFTVPRSMSRQQLEKLQIHIESHGYLTQVSMSKVLNISWRKYGA